MIMVTTYMFNVSYVTGETGWLVGFPGLVDKIKMSHVMYGEVSATGQSPGSLVVRCAGVAGSHRLGG